MKEFLNQLADVFIGFPPILLVVLAPLCGGVVSVIVVALKGGPEADSPKKILGRLVVGWLTGAFCGPVLSGFFTAPPYTVGFVAGAGGYWGITEYMKKKQDELLNKP